jgi:hypothetical protein
MDMRKYGGGGFIKVEHVRNGPLDAQIAAIKQGKYDKPDLVFESGQILSLNVTNTAILLQAYGPESASWIGKEVRLKVGQVKFEKKLQDAVVVEPVTPSLTLAEKAAAAAKLNKARKANNNSFGEDDDGRGDGGRGDMNDDMDDKVPF